MSYQLILSTDTLDQGRIKINNFFQSSSGTWSAATPNYSVISRNGVNNYNTFSGNYGFITGKNNTGETSSDYSSITGGYKNKVNSDFDVIGGGLNNKIYSSSNYSSIINGKNGKATGNYSFIGGGIASTVNSGPYSTIINGKNNKTYYKCSSVINGYGNVAKGFFGTVLNGSIAKIQTGNNALRNFNTILNGGLCYIYATSNGTGNLIHGGVYNYINNSSYVFEFGKFLTASNKKYQLLFGSGAYSARLSSPNNYEATFGRAGSRKIRLNFDSTPNAYLATGGGGSWQTSGADYAEYFEWIDGNLNSEERVGYFVEIKNGKIQKATTTETIGIVSTTSAFIGDSSQDYWSEVYLKDEWGKSILEKYQVYEFVNNIEKNKLNEDKIKIYFSIDNKSYIHLPSINSPEGILTTSYDKQQGTYIETIEEFKINPQYDAKMTYTPRKDRKEWDVIGLIGKLRVRTSEQITGNFVDVDTNTGMAKNGTTYPVLKKFKDFDGNYGIVLIFFK